jgi:hypothetical protein
MITDKSLFLFKTSPAMSYTTAGTVAMDASCFIEPLKGSTLTCNQDVEEIETVSGGFDQDPAVPGNKSANVTLSFPITPSDGTNAPGWMAVGQCAGMSINHTGSTWTLSPVNDSTNTGVVNYYAGAGSDGVCLLYKAYNTNYDWKVTVEAGKVPKIEYTGQGAFYGIPTDSTLPTVSKAGINATAFKSATVTINGQSAYKLISAELSGNQAVAVTVDPSQAGGIDRGEITARKIKFTAKVYAVKAGTIDPVTALEAKTEGALSFGWGSGANHITMGGSYAQITKCTPADENGIVTWGIEGQLNRNDFAMSINP